MEPLLITLIVFSVVITLIFCVFGVIAIKEVRKKGDFQKEHFEYSKNEFGTIKEGVGRIYDSLETKISPQLETLYRSTEGIRKTLETETLVKMLSQIGFKSQEVGKNTTIAFGIKVESMLVSYIIKLQNDERMFIMFSFSKKIPTNNAKVLSEILRMNSDNPAGSIDLKSIGNKDFLFYRDTITPYDSISPKILEELIDKQMDFHKNVGEILKINSEKIEQYMFSDYFDAVTLEKKSKS